MYELGEQARRACRDTIGDALRRAALRFSDRIALTFGPRRWSFAELDRGADRVARSLHAAGLVHGDRVVAYGRNSDGYLLGFLGCVRAGLIHVPANYALTAPELEYILRQCGARALLSQPMLAAKADAASTNAGDILRGTLDDGTGSLDVLAAALAPGYDTLQMPPPDAELTDTDLAQIIYTAGTTGAPKGAMMTHRAYLAEYAAAAQVLDYSAADRALAALPLYHTAQMHSLTMPLLLAGGETLLVEAPEPALVLRLIEEQRITSFFAPPTVWISLLRHDDFDRRDLSSLRQIMYGAAIMPLPVLQELRRRLPGARPYQGYGQSEIGPLATVLRPEEHDAHPGSAGRPIPTVQTRIVDAEMRDVPPGQAGEIIHRSPQLLVGYWGMPDETRAAFAGGWFHSGDVGTMDAGGFITIVDRMRDVINTGGVLVASRDVEDAILTHPAVSECAVIALPDPHWIEMVAAVVVLRAGHLATEGELMAHVRASIAPYKVPKRVILTNHLPRNTAGKMLKRELRAQYGGKVDTSPGTATQP
ncbi:fatty acyl-CoA synthetase [Paracraurococcus ruber]|uniref:Acyl-CoA synthetase n=1 Tax=Paracraurococcus ruber TaxID=77675 RepID=A0ABS1D5X3_9PROT|nr:fatty acyl-CoA synthetase [Paracraurococcus ruber]MBK1662288.1 acyl-CoA synthetase [Paracraurococcus ruber]TDG13161.1 acyl-CoA synthetase [Paracraurococcus ruber]